MKKIIPLTQFNIQRPEKILYHLSISTFKNFFDSLKGERLKSFLLRIDEILEKNNIVYEYVDLTEEKYLEWLPYYEAKMNEHGHELIATKEWYKEETRKGFSIKALFFYRDKKMVGSGIMAFKENKVFLAFRATDRITISHKSFGNLGCVTDFIRLRLICKEGNIKTVINRSRNIFGGDTTLGYLEFRLRFGYKPRPNLGADFSDTVPTNDKGFILFYGIHNTEFVLFLLQPKGQKNEEHFKNIPILSEIPFKKIFY